MRYSSLILLLVAVEVNGQTCTPSSNQVYESLQGCDSIKKSVEERVLFPDGHVTSVIQDGYGKCEKKAACGFSYWFTGKEECWPKFNSPVIRDKNWTRTVVNQEISMQYAGTCSERAGDHVETVPIYGPKCINGRETTASVDWDCPIYGGGGWLPLPVPFPNIGWDNPCFIWGFTSGLCQPEVNK